MKTTPTSTWRETTLAELVEFHDHRRIPLSSRERASRKGEYPYYGASGVIDHVDHYIFDGPYLLISEDGENLNSRKTPIAFRASGKFWVNNHAHIVRGKPNIAHDRFLEYLIAVKDISGLVTGAAQPKLSQANLKIMKLRVPDFAMQTVILNILCAYDDLIENNTQQIKILEDMAQMLYREWFVNFRYPGHEKVRMVESELGTIPEGWGVHTVGTISENFDSKRKPLSSMERAKRPGPYPYYGAAKIVDSIDGFLFDGRYLLFAEDGTVITDDRHPVLQLTNGKFWPNNHTHVLKGRFPVSTYFLYLAMRQVDISGYITGAAQPKITQANLNRIPVVVGSPESLRSFESFIGPLLDQVAVLESKQANLRTTRDLLLPKLISGEIPVEVAAHLVEQTV